MGLRVKNGDYGFLFGLKSDTLTLICQSMQQFHLLKTMELLCYRLKIPLTPNPMNDKIDLKRYGQWVSVIGSTRLNQEIDNLTFITENLPIFSNEAAEVATKKLNSKNSTNGKYHGLANK